LTGQFRVLSAESQAEYESLLDEFVRVEKAADGLELELVRKMAESNWISRRAVRLQEGCFSKNRNPPKLEKGTAAVTIAIDHLERYVRYQTAADRAYARAAAELAKHRKERLAAERGFDPQNAATPPSASAQLMKKEVAAA
jgi:hypothetical protein